MTMVHPATQHVPRTKLHPPRLPVDVIDRPRLMSRLDRASDAKLTLLWAPAGYGKSTPLASWRAAGERPMAWLSLDEHDDTLSAFVHALVAAIQAVLPGWGKDTLALLNLPEPCSVRTFVDLGPGMARMVSALTARDRPSGYLRRLHAAFSADAPVAPRGAPTEGPQADEPVEPLTWREQDVLKQLSHRLSNKEIASALDISPLTVKKHAESIYRELRVNGRRDAITRAQALGLI